MASRSHVPCRDRLDVDSAYASRSTSHAGAGASQGRTTPSPTIVRSAPLTAGEQPHQQVHQHRPRAGTEADGRPAPVEGGLTPSPKPVPSPPRTGTKDTKRSTTTRAGQYLSRRRDAPSCFEPGRPGVRTTISCVNPASASTAPAAHRCLAAIPTVPGSGLRAASSSSSARLLVQLRQVLPLRRSPHPPPAAATAAAGAVPAARPAHVLLVVLRPAALARRDRRRGAHRDRRPRRHPTSPCRLPLDLRRSPGLPRTSTTSAGSGSVDRRRIRVPQRLDRPCQPARFSYTIDRRQLFAGRSSATSSTSSSPDAHWSTSITRTPSPPGRVGRLDHHHTMPRPSSRTTVSTGDRTASVDHRRRHDLPLDLFPEPR